MSLIRLTIDDEARGFPRVSGDEPQRHNLSVTTFTFSPRERG